MKSNSSYPVAKRIMDVAVAGVALILLSPLIALVAIAVRLRLGSPALFRQPRPGLNGRVFECLKFRTMTDLRDERGNLLPDAMRLPAFGEFLRRTSLDELPQLWSVVKGDMSLVGPRPLMVRYLPRYSAEQARRHLVQPGITGWAQVNGRNAIDWDRKLALDTWYVDHRSLSLDLKILAMTVRIVITASGVSRDGQVSMEEFLGNTASE
jgi:lipopolysaccharide/colanic/teichoic acid biosynthesis glycosyltransferase